MAKTPELPPKKDVMLALLERSSVFIHLDPRNDAVRVPPWFKKQPQLVLQVGLNMAVRIPDLAVEDDAVSCTLSFSRSPFFCWVPWKAVFALVGDDGKGMLWPNDIPPEVAAQQAEQARKEQARAQIRPATAVADPAEGSARAAEAPAPAEPAPRAVKATKKRAASPRVRSAQKAGDLARPRAAEPVAAPPGPAARESKRPLPPYLRIVK